MITEEFIEHSTDLYPLTPKRISRAAALSAFSFFHCITGLLNRMMQEKRIQFIYFHHTFANEEQPFERMLEKLTETHTFIGYSQAVEKLVNGDIDKPYIAVSFDDGFKCSLRGVEILNRFGIKACFFLIGSMIGETDFDTIKRFNRERLLRPPIRYMSWDEVEMLLKTGHEIGGHTMTHPVLSKLSSQQIQFEIGESHRLLTRRLGKVKHFAWPFGSSSHINNQATKTVFETGFESCASAARGCHLPGSKSSLQSIIVRRDYIQATWPLHHVYYFFSKNIRQEKAAVSRGLSV
jgi:peptidoglycan/xylan/chitin deacetylase (PgdA/CDA1 family)